MEIRFLGVRGSVAVSSPQMARMGGNTSCLEVVSGDHRLILDAGTGLRALGESLASTSPLKLTMLFSHLHWDHVQGFPFFAPAYRPDVELKLYGPGEGGGEALHSALKRQMEPPTFPVPLSAMRSKRTFSSAVPGEPFEVGPFRITPLDLPHPQGCVGYRIEEGAKSFVYCTDVELTREQLTPALERGLGGADVLVLDAQYSQAEYQGHQGPPRKGWGHSTNVDAARIAQAVGARRLLLFHHDPSHTDEQVELLAEEAKAHFNASEPARESLSLTLAA